MRNFKMVIQYDGSRYKGWQIQQDNDLTVQGKIQAVLTKMAEEPVEVIGCERTDIGAHAENYIGNFHTICDLSKEMILNYLYEFLPEDIVVKSIQEVGERFHARYNVKSMTYVYTIDNNPFRNVFNRKYTYHTEGKLDIFEMEKAAEVLVGTHDFQSFTTLKAGNKSTVRTLNFIDITVNEGIIKIEMNANDFLWNMPRIISGILLEAGTGKLKVEGVQKLLDEKKKPEGGPIAKAKGLCLTEVTY